MENTEIGPQLTAAYAAARDWIYDTFEDAPDTLSNDEVRAAIYRHYDGGWNAFILTCR